MAAQETHRPVILVVDDEPLIAQLVAETLAAEGYEVETASNGREALEKTPLRARLTSFCVICGCRSSTAWDSIESLKRGIQTCSGASRS